MPDISLLDVVLSSGPIMLPFLVIVAFLKGWIVPRHAFRADQTGLLIMAEKLEQAQSRAMAQGKPKAIKPAFSPPGQSIDMHQKPVCCPYCGRYGDLGSCVGCGAPTAPVRPQTRRMGLLGCRLRPASEIREGWCPDAVDYACQSGLQLHAGHG